MVEMGPQLVENVLIALDGRYGLGAYGRIRRGPPDSPDAGQRIGGRDMFAWWMRMMSTRNERAVTYVIFTPYS